VSGKVTLDGKPVVSGKVIFHPEEGKSTSTGLKEDGTFELKALKPGKYTLTVEAGPTVPLKYGDPTKSGLQVVVLSGKNGHDVELSK
jgi:hypothetical protein